MHTAKLPVLLVPHLLTRLFLLTSAANPECDSTYSWSGSNFCTVFSNPQAASLKFNTSATVLTCTDPRYGDFRLHANNFRFTTDSSFIAFPRRTEDVVAILRQALQNGLRPTVRSGGHCFEDFWSNNTGGLLIDVSLMTRVSPKIGDVVWVEAGILLGDLYSILYKDYGLAVPGGVCLDVAVGGHVLGAGYGFLSRKFGLISDYVQAAEIVYVKSDGTVGVALVGSNSTCPTERDLFWALRGGGSQNFGIVTRLAFQNLPPSPPTALWLDLEWTLAELGETRFGDILTKYVDFFLSNSNVSSPFCDMFTDLNIRLASNGSVLSLRVLVIGDRQDLIELFFRYVGISSKKVTCKKMSLNRYLLTSPNSAGPSYYLRRSAYMVGPLPKRHRDTMWQYFANETLHHNVKSGSVRLRGFGCAVSAFSNNATAYAHRNAIIKMEFAGSWAKPADAHLVEDWSRRFYFSLYGENGPLPDDVMDGCYYNYPDRDLVNWQQLYFKDNYEKLREVKRQWDPLNIFWHRQSVEP